MSTERSFARPWHQQAELYKLWRLALFTGNPTLCPHLRPGTQIKETQLQIRADPATAQDQEQPPDQRKQEIGRNLDNQMQPPTRYAISERLER